MFFLIFNIFLFIGVSWPFSQIECQILIIQTVVNQHNLTFYIAYVTQVGHLKFRYASWAIAFF
jgi:hypothetical protein